MNTTGSWTDRHIQMIMRAFTVIRGPKIVQILCGPGIQPASLANAISAWMVRLADRLSYLAWRKTRTGARKTLLLPDSSAMKEDEFRFYVTFRDVMRTWSGVGAKRKP